MKIKIASIYYIKPMSKMIIAFCLCLATNTTIAQIAKNQWILSSGISANYIPNINPEFNQLTINTPVSIGYFVRNKSAFGVRGSYAYKDGLTYIRLKYSSFSSFEGFVLEKQNQFSVGPFARYYLLPIQNRFNVYTELAYGYGKFTSKIFFDELTGTSHNYIATIAPVYFVNEYIGLELNLTYAYQVAKGAFEGTTSGIFVGGGFQFHFNKPKE